MLLNPLRLVRIRQGTHFKRNYLLLYYCYGHQEFVSAIYLWHTWRLTLDITTSEEIVIVIVQIKTQKKEEALQSIYSYMQTTVSKKSWTKLETYLQCLTQRQEQSKYENVIIREAFTKEGQTRRNQSKRHEKK